VLVEHERGVRSIGLDPVLLDRPVAAPFLAALRVVADAPAAPKIPLLRSTSSANTAHVEASSGRIVYDTLGSLLIN
jgi:hypothetical protein